MGRNSARRRQLIHLYHEQGLSIRQIAEFMSEAPTTIYRWLDEEGIERREPGRQSECPPCDELKRVLQRYRGSVSDTARYYSRPDQTIRGWIKRCGLDHAYPARATQSERHLSRSQSLRRVASDTSVPQTDVKPVKRKRP